MYAIIWVIFFPQIPPFSTPLFLVFRIFSWTQLQLPNHDFFQVKHFFFSTKTAGFWQIFVSHEKCDGINRHPKPGTPGPQAPGDEMMTRKVTVLAAFGLVCDPQKRQGRKTIICKTYHHHQHVLQKKIHRSLDFLLVFELEVTFFVLQVEICSTCFEATNVTPTAENVRRALEVALGGVRSLRCRVAVFSK